MHMYNNILAWLLTRAFMLLGRDLDGPKLVSPIKEFMENITTDLYPC